MNARLVKEQLETKKKFKIIAKRIESRLSSFIHPFQYALENNDEEGASYTTKTRSHSLPSIISQGRLSNESKLHETINCITPKNQI